MRHNLVEGLMAAVVLVAAGLFLAFAVVHGPPHPRESYTVLAHFSDAGGLKEGDRVNLHGIQVGTVDRVGVDPSSLLATVGMSIRGDIHLPEDTVAAVAAVGPLGGKEVELTPGRSRADIPPGGRITRTQAYKSLEQTVGNRIFGAGLGSP